MSKEPLLLPSARSAVLLGPRPISPWWRRGAISAGMLVVIVGAADVTSRVGERVLGADAALFAFAPIALIDDPSLITAITGTTTPPAEEVEAATSTVVVPERIRIPSIGVSAAVEAVGKKADGAMATPKRFSDVAWYSLGSRPGALGNAVFAGHVNNAISLAGVFAELHTLGVGSSIIIEGTHGERLQYKVVRTETFPADTAPAEEIFKTTGPSQIVLITCDGEWDSLAHSYDKRLVLFAKLVM